MNELRFKDAPVGTISEALTITVKRGTTVVNLTAYTARLRMERITATNTTTLVVTSRTCAVTSLGIVSFQPIAADVATAGDYLCEFTVLSGGNTYFRSPIINWRLTTNLASVA
jgi:hypothetical protein